MFFNARTITVFILVLMDSDTRKCAEFVARHKTFTNLQLVTSAHCELHSYTLVNEDTVHVDHENVPYFLTGKPF